MEVVYGFALAVYGWLIRVAALFHPKAKEWIAGRQHWERNMSSLLKEPEKRIWFHCSSLGEYEQGRPVLERLRSEYPDCKIVLTFFSPSGFIQKKNETLVDYVFYLPLDGAVNSRRFIEIVNPYFAVFVKYEFWHFYIKILKDKKIPSFVISAIFRPSQIYFKNYGKFFYTILQRITHLFVQNQTSLELLYDSKLTNVTVSGDTRFDRVYMNSMNSKNLERIAAFKNGKPLFIAGSTWPSDEKILSLFIGDYKDKLKFIIVPHEITSGAIQRLRRQLPVKALLYSELSTQSSEGINILIIDNIGMLSSLYSYADYAYIGGGFGSGIHNSLEAAVYGLPVFFGTNYKKFAEAVQMIQMGTAFSFTDYNNFLQQFETVFTNPSRLEEIHKKNMRFIDSSRGATDVILNYLKMNYPGCKQ
ncbi:MAG: glycosyltransferase N-terminal domain-containing protein [Bacteroidota bacterium]